MTSALHALTVATAVGAGAAGGVFFAFSTFVMDGLTRLPAAAGIGAMQQVNVTAVRPAFMTLLFGTAAGSAVLAVHAVRASGERSSTLLVAGAGLYLAGVVGLTVGYHVPRNDALAALDPLAPGSAAAWADYVTAWTRANHVRAASGLAAAACYTVALLTRA
jgi:uncharacterized membrane protein